MTRQIGGKSVCEGLSEIIEPRHTALVIVDMQNDFCSPQGAVAKNRAVDHPFIHSCIGPQARLARTAQEVGALVVVVKNTTERDCASESPARLYTKLHGSGRSLPFVEHTVEGTWGHEVIDDLKDLTQEAPVIRKNRSSAFFNTNLPSLLRSNSIETVIVTGVGTEGCVASTARDAQETDHYVVVPRDCVGSFSPDLHDATLKVLAHRCEVVDSDDVLAIWDEARIPAAASAKS
jgi:nicotinamidase-related amidase